MRDFSATHNRSVTHMSKAFHDGFRLIIANTLAFMPFVAQAQEWIADSKTACQVWNERPSPGESISWTGSCSNGKATGMGALQWYLNGKPGSRYEGEFRDGKRHGKGINIWASGARYEGDWRDEKRHGKGTYVWASGDRYEGDWLDGKRQGKGTFVFANGTRVEGDWLDGKLEKKCVTDTECVALRDSTKPSGISPSSLAGSSAESSAKIAGSTLAVSARYGSASCAIAVPIAAFSNSPVDSEKISRSILSSTWGKTRSDDKPNCENGLAQGFGELAVVLKGEYWKFHGNVVNGKYEGKVEYSIFKDTSSVMGRVFSQWVIDDKSYSEADYFAALNSRKSVPGKSVVSEIDEKELAKKIKACNTVANVDCIKSILMNLPVVPCKAPVEEIYSVYRGVCVNGTPNGWGIATTTDANSKDFVLGEFSSGLLNGFGAVRRTSCSNLDCFAGRYVTADNFGWFQAGTKQLDCTSTSKPVCVKQDEKNRQEQQRLAEQRRQEEARRDDRVRRNAEIYQAERAVGNDRRFYSCSFRCRSGVFDASDKMTLTIKADEDWVALDALKPKSTEICRKYRQGFYSSDESCEEIR